MSPTAYSVNELICVLLPSVTIKVLMTTPMVDSAIWGSLSLCSGAIVSHNWLIVNHLLSGAKAVLYSDFFYGSSWFPR